MTSATSSSRLCTAHPATRGSCPAPRLGSAACAGPDDRALFAGSSTTPPCSRRATRRWPWRCAARGTASDDRTPDLVGPFLCPVARSTSCSPLPADAAGGAGVAGASIRRCRGVHDAVRTADADGRRRRWSASRRRWRRSATTAPGCWPRTCSGSSRVAVRTRGSSRCRAATLRRPPSTWSPSPAGTRPSTAPAASTADAFPTEAELARVPAWRCAERELPLQAHRRPAPRRAQHRRRDGLRAARRAQRAGRDAVSRSPAPTATAVAAVLAERDGAPLADGGRGPGPDHDVHARARAVPVVRLLRRHRPIDDLRALGLLDDEEALA